MRLLRLSAFEAVARASPWLNEELGVGGDDNGIPATRNYELEADQEYITGQRSKDQTHLLQG